MLTSNQVNNLQSTRFTSELEAMESSNDYNPPLQQKFSSKSYVNKTVGFSKCLQHKLKLKTVVCK